MRRLPLFVLDSREAYTPCAVESVESIARIDGQPVKLDALPEAGGRMDFPANPATWAPHVQRGHGGAGYWRRMAGGGLVWIQHWLWFVHNPKSYAGVGEHEGDWEFLQVGYAHDTPVCMTASQHRNGEARMWWDVERRDGRPVIYIARDSHAMYFEPVRGSIADDTCDGAGATLDLSWRDFGAWAHWPGRWGNSTGAGMSPQSPGRQGDRWGRPHRFHSLAR